MQLPRHSTIAAYASLFIALGGTSYAAIKLPANSVGSRELRNRSVKVADLSPSARPPSRARIAQAVTDVVTDPATGINIKVTGEKGDTGAQGPAGPAGPAGAPGVAKVIVRDAVSGDVAPQSEGSASAHCAAGEKVLGGGGRFEGAGAILSMSMPLSDPDQGWGVVFTNASTSNAGRVHAFAVCAVVGG